jgi:3-phenylpropionate/trans-cinnamate dioxygenase ferredoxin reductase component
MKHFTYLIIGAGMTADAAVKGIRELDQKGTVGVIGQEPHPPYARPPLSKKLWQGKPLDSIWRGTEKLGVTLLLGRRAEALDADNKKVRDDRGEVYRYDKLLIATGGTPRRLPFGGDEVIYFRTLDDYQKLRSRADSGRRFAVIGGGFIGSEIAAALAQNGKEVVMIFPEPDICSRVFPADLAAYVTAYYRGKGVEVLAGQTVADIGRKGGLSVVVTGAGRCIDADAVVAGLGIDLNLELAKQAGLPIDNGVTVDEFLRAGRPEIFVAGDLASFYNPALGQRLRVEHEDNAVIMGKQAGRNMAGAAEPYHHLPFFYSDLFDLGYEAVGELDSRLETVADWKEPFREGVIYYVREGRVRGVLLWNVWDQVDAARRLIASAAKVVPGELDGLLSRVE